MQKIINSLILNSVVVRVEGGLGNQLFQYACGRSLADRLGCGLAFDLRGLDVQGDRPFQLDFYNVRAEIAADELLNSLPDARPTRWRRLKVRAAEFWPVLNSLQVFWPRSFAFDKRFNQLRRPVYLVGYWQSEKYFSWNRASILRDIQPLLPLPPNTPWVYQIENTASVALHIRRGDYISHLASAKFHGLCDISYYKTAVEELKKRVSNIQIFVFSDDMDWVKNNLVLDVTTHYVDAFGADAGRFDIELMRRCKHHIIANSSFSWWSAWLCTYPHQLVYAPLRWFADKQTDTADVIPLRWHKIA